MPSNFPLARSVDVVSIFPFKCAHKGDAGRSYFILSRNSRLILEMFSGPPRPARWGLKKLFLGFFLLDLKVRRTRNFSCWLNEKDFMLDSVIMNILEIKKLKKFNPHSYHMRTIVHLILYHYKHIRAYVARQRKIDEPLLPKLIKLLSIWWLRILDSCLFMHRSETIKTQMNGE